MGQVIDLQQRRRQGRQDPPGPVPAAVAWPMTPVGYAQAMLEPSWALWRSLVAGYAGFWLAPYGIEVRLAESRPRRPTKARATSGL